MPTPAKLNIGDCCAYALAVQTGEPMLFKGDDFSGPSTPRGGRGCLHHATYRSRPSANAGPMTIPG